MKQIFFFCDRLLEPKIKDFLRVTDLAVSFSRNLIGLRTQDGEEGCIIEYYHDVDDNLSDPREAIVSSFYVGNKLHRKLFKELEDKLYIKFING